MTDRKSYLMRDFGIVVLSIIIAVILIQTGAVKDLLTSSEETRILGSFLGGLFLVSIFTAAPAAVTLVEIAQANSIFLVAFFGAIGGVIGDYIIFRFVKDAISEDIIYLIKKNGYKRWLSIFHLRFFGWLIPFIGALIVASPLPDEIGLAMMGLSKLKTSQFIPLVFLIDFLGILALGVIAKSML